MKAALSNPEHIELSLGDRRASAELRRTQRRVLRIEVKPSGDVVVFAPSGETLSAVQSRVKRKGPWIFREIDRIARRTKTFNRPPSTRT